MPNLAHDAFTNSLFAEWLYGDYNAGKLRAFNFLYSIDGVSDYMDYLLDSRRDQEYLERHGMDLSDVHDPRKLHSTSSGSSMISFASKMVSRNVDDLYKSSKKKKKR